MTVYRVTKNGKPQGCEYKTATEASLMAATLEVCCPDQGEFGWVACEPMIAVLDENYGRSLLV